jgi:hypothetical protein
MKQWILRTFFQEELYKRDTEAIKLGSMDAFAKARKDVEMSMIDDTDEKADKLANERLVALLTTVDDKLIVSVSKTGQLLIGGERPEESTLANLKSDAEFLVKSDIWKLLYETPKALAEKAMFVDDGKLETQLLKGRAILYMLSTQKKIVDTFLKLYTAK